LYARNRLRIKLFIFFLNSDLAKGGGASAPLALPGFALGIGPLFLQKVQSYTTF